MDELIKQVANYIINNRATINETAGAFGKSVSSIKKYINDADKLQRIDFELYQKVKEVQKIVELNGQIAGGRIGKRSASVSDYDSDEETQQLLSEVSLANQTYFNTNESILNDVRKR